MFQQLIRALAPVKTVKSRLARALAGSSNGNQSGAEGTAFSRNCETREQRLSDTLRRALPGITYISVQDISGGCGAMFEINVEAQEFRGLSTVKQHRLVTDSLKSEIAEMHGIRINTVPPPADDK